MEKHRLWAAVLVTFGVAAGYALDMHATVPDSVPLDFAVNSVDDRYDGCTDKMQDKVQEYLNKERNNNQKFGTAWDRADNFYLKTWPKRKDRPPFLEKEHVMAMYAYSLGQPKIYDDFNQAVRTQKSKYTSPAFQYHALHFYLTDAIQTLNCHTKNKRCVTTYRRTKMSFTKVKINTVFRFGAFTSSSLGDYAYVNFGEKSCFNITSCFGADISCCTALGKHEREVLIPPYEVFNVTKIEKRKTAKNELPCEVVYTVKSIKSYSKLNCALVPGYKKGGNALG